MDTRTTCDLSNVFYFTAAGRSVSFCPLLFEFCRVCSPLWFCDKFISYLPSLHPSASPTRLTCHSTLTPTLHDTVHLSLSSQASLTRTHAYIFYFRSIRTVHFRLHVAFVVCREFTIRRTIPFPRSFVAVRFSTPRSLSAFFFYDK